jgi:hypothetical protein
MSHSCYADVVDYYKPLIFCKRDNELYNDHFLSRLIVPEDVFEGYCPWQKDGDGPYKEIVLNGWKLTNLGIEIGKKKKLYANQWTKVENPDLVVYLINESEYSNVGEFEIAVIASDLASLDAFCIDFMDKFDNNYPISGPGVAAQAWY